MPKLREIAVAYDNLVSISTTFLTVRSNMLSMLEVKELGDVVAK